MSLLKPPAPRPSSTAVSTQVAAPQDLRKGLGLLGNWKVARVERAANTHAASSLTLRAAEGAEDVGRHALELKVSEIKSALTARAVPALAAIQTELIGRLGQSKTMMAATWAEGLNGQISLRNHLLRGVEAMAAQGMLTLDELAEAKAMIVEDFGRDISALRNATGRAMDAIDAHATRATDHIAKQSDK